MKTALLLLLASVTAVHTTPAKRLIATGWDSPTPAQFRDHVASFEQWPFVRWCQILASSYNEALWNDQVLKEPLAYRTVEAVNHARNTLLAGFTLLRDLGTEGAGFSDLSIKRAIEEGLIPGPRLLVATKAIVATASYVPGPLGFAETVILPKGAQEASGIPEVLKAVREQVGAGADWVKVYADYGQGPGGKEVPTFSVEELEALVAEAHSSGRLVAAHATTAEGMRRAVLAGVDTIEHGYHGTTEVFALMAKRGVAYLPTAGGVHGKRFPALVLAKSGGQHGINCGWRFVLVRLRLAFFEREEFTD
jgi:imidazolonepropionase-like amidohydrolase